MNKNQLITEVISIHSVLNEKKKYLHPHFYKTKDLKRELNKIKEQPIENVLNNLEKLAVILKSISSLLIYQPVNSAIQLLWRLKALARLIANPDKINQISFQTRLHDLCDHINQIKITKNKLHSYHMP